MDFKRDFKEDEVLKELYLTPVQNECTITDKESTNISEEGVIHPNHYKTKNYECWDVFIDIATEYGMGPVEAALFFNVLKYIWRYKAKDNPIKDLNKAKNFIDKIIKSIEEGKI